MNCYNEANDDDFAYIHIWLQNALRDRPGKRPMPTKKPRLMVNMHELKMALFSRSAVYAVVMKFLQLLF